MVEDVGDRAAQRLGAVDHDQDRPGAVQPMVTQRGERIGHDRGVLGGALGQAQRDLRAVQGDPERNHAAALGHLDPVDHERDLVQPRQVGAQQLGQGVLGGGHEPAGDRRLGGAAGRPTALRSC